MSAFSIPVRVARPRRPSPLVTLLGTLSLLAPPLLAGQVQAGAAPGKGTAATAGAGVATEATDVPLVLYWNEAKELLTPTPIAGARTVVLSVAERKALRRSDSGLRQLRQAEPGAGDAVDLEGRYQSVFVSLVDSAGKLRIICLDAEPKADSRPAESNGGSRGR